MGNSQQKVSAYADNMMFTLTKPVISLPNLLREFEIYGAMSNLKIYFTKSEAIGVGISQPQILQLQATFKLKWTDNALKYLGTAIPSKFSKIFNLNFPPLLKSVRTVLNKWHTGHFIHGLAAVKYYTFIRSCLSKSLQVTSN